MKPHILQSSPASCYVSHLRSKHSLQHLVLNTRNLCCSAILGDQLHSLTKQVKLHFSYFGIKVLREVTGRQVSEQNGSKHSPNLICSYFLRKFNLYFLMSLPHIWTLPHLQRVYYESVNYYIVLHSVGLTYIYT